MKKGRKIINFSLLFIMITTAKAQSIHDSLLTVQLFDGERNLYLEIITNESKLNGPKQEFRFFKSKNSFVRVNVHFDSSNKSILNFQKLSEIFNDNKYQSDSITLLTGIYYDSTRQMNDYRIIFCNDKACKSAFVNDIRLNEYLKRKIKERLPPNNYPLLFIKEWKCETTPLYSIYN